MTISRKVEWRCRRGMLELDVIFQKFFNDHYEKLSEDQKKIFEQLLEHEDPVLFDWLVTELPCENKVLQPIVKNILTGSL